MFIPTSAISGVNRDAADRSSRGPGRRGGTAGGLPARASGYRWRLRRHDDAAQPLLGLHAPGGASAAARGDRGRAPAGRLRCGAREFRSALGDLQPSRNRGEPRRRGQGLRAGSRTLGAARVGGAARAAVGRRQQHRRSGWPRRRMGGRRRLAPPARAAHRDALAAERGAWNERRRRTVRRPGRATLRSRHRSADRLACGRHPFSERRRLRRGACRCALDRLPGRRARSGQAVLRRASRVLALITPDDGSGRTIVVGGHPAARVASD